MRTRSHTRATNTRQATQPVRKFVAFLLALLILNGSLDTPDIKDSMYWDGSDYTEDASYNEMESFYELFTEGLLEWEDFVPEHDEDPGDTDKQIKSPLDIALYTPTYTETARRPFRNRKNYAQLTESTATVALPTDSPPPDGGHTS